LRLASEGLQRHLQVVRKLAVFCCGLYTVFSHLGHFLVDQRFVLLQGPFGLSKQKVDFIICGKRLFRLRVGSDRKAGEKNKGRGTPQ
jgi:hypothetical protein